MARLIIGLYFCLELFGYANGEQCFYLDVLKVGFQTCLFGCCSRLSSPCCNLFSSSKYLYYVFGGSVGGLVLLTCFIAVCCALCNSSNRRVHTTTQAQPSIAVVSAPAQPGMVGPYYPYGGPHANAGYQYGGYPGAGYPPNQQPQSCTLPGQVDDAPPKYQSKGNDGSASEPPTGQHPPPNRPQE